MLVQTVLFEKSLFEEANRLACIILKLGEAENLFQVSGQAYDAEAKLHVIAERIGLTFEGLINKSSVKGGHEAVSQTLKTIYEKAYEIFLDGSPSFTPGSFEAYEQGYRLHAFLAGVEVKDHEVKRILKDKLQELVQKQESEIHQTRRQIMDALDLF